jgi:hypothetical protein
MDMNEADEQAGHEAASTQEAANEVDRDTRDTAAQAILDGDIDQETGEHTDEALEEIDVDEDDVIESLQLRVVALEGVLRRILAEPQLLACGDKHFCNELIALIDAT